MPGSPSESQRWYGVSQIAIINFFFQKNRQSHQVAAVAALVFAVSERKRKIRYRSDGGDMIEPMEEADVE